MDLFSRRRKAPVVPEDAPQFAAQAAAASSQDYSLRARLMELEERLSQLTARTDEKLETFHSHIIKNLEAKWGRFEHTDRRFKELIRGEQVSSAAQLSTLKSGGMEYIMQKGETERKVVTELELKLGAMDHRVAQMGVLLDRATQQELDTNPEQSRSLVPSLVSLRKGFGQNFRGARGGAPMPQLQYNVALEHLQRQKPLRDF